MTGDTTLPPSGFLPSADGFAFTNSWPSAPAVTVQTPLGPIGIGNAANGLCGGMVYAALDYWLAGLVPPVARPAPGTPLYRYIVRRLIDSWHVPAGVAEYYLWMNLPDADASTDLLGRTVVIQRGVSWRTIEQQWPLIKASIDSGVPATLGVVTEKSANPALLGNNHQVAAYAYSTAGTEVTLRAYDPNSGQDDNVWIRFDGSNPQLATTFASNVNLDLPIRGFFTTAYSPASPP
ncbi:MAG TPA: hypothetical protein VMR14_05150 [Streptosporangiaceae bacterium]|nr:hypothetical protein [Streptosporangiaceae bacterium]